MNEGLKEDGSGPSLIPPERRRSSLSEPEGSVRRGLPSSSQAEQGRPPLLHNDMHDHTEVAAPSGRGTGRISRTLVNFWLDTLLAAVFVSLCITAVIVQFVFPPGVAARGWTLWGMTYGQWSSLQFAQVALLGLGVLVHVMLHWTWVCSVLTKRVLHKAVLPDDGIRTVYGVGLLIVLLVGAALAVGLAQWMIVQPS
ncbi:MAG: DUF4405 domain-containing protein [Fuerstiella sp.]